MASSTDQAPKLGKSRINEQQDIETRNRKALTEILVQLEELRATRPSKTITARKSDRTQRTTERILSATYEVFTEVGHSGLSLRKVADHAGIAVGNLTYHFPTKNALLEAMLREATADYVDEHLAQFEPGKDTPLQILMNLVEFYIRNARTSHQFFYQLWGYAGSGEEARRIVRTLYRPIGRLFYYLVRSANPKLNDQEIRRVTLQIFSLEEGYKLFMGMDPDPSSGLDTAEEDIRALTKMIIFSDRP